MDALSEATPHAVAFDAEFFETMYRACDDPWGIGQHWYEARKRAMLLSVLPRARFRRAFEPGCGNGELSLSLAERCDALVAGDAVDTAVRRTTQRCATLPNVSVRTMRLPQDWPEGRFDLVVLSELLYYLSPAALACLYERLGSSLTDDGCVVACHWKHAFAGAPRVGAAVHDELSHRLSIAHQARYEDADFVLDLWSREKRSPAQLEGLR